jgi:hypothetical protein
MTNRLALPLFALLLPLPAAAQLGPGGTQSWNQSSPGLGIAMEADAYMGRALAAGDFDCDGFDDLAIGMPGEDLIGGDDAGRLIVLYGSPAGPAADGSQVWGQNSPVILDDAEPGDGFGYVLTAGDFDGDDCADLVVGVPGEDIGADSNAGAVNVLYGSAAGLSGDNDDFWHQDLATLTGNAEPADRFGAALAIGDFDGDGLDDLAIGSPGEAIGAAGNAGMVHVIWGSIFGLAAGDSVALWRGNGLSGSPQVDEFLGAALAAGQFGIISGDELAIGAPRRDLDSGVQQAGVVILVSDVDGNALHSEWSQNSNGVPGVAEDFDRFGAPLAAGDFDGDGVDELVVTATEEDIGAPVIGSVGAVHILDFDGDSMQQWLQNDLAPEQSEIGDRFGAALAVGDFDADGIDDLAVGVPEENLGPLVAAGLIHVLYGEPGTGLSAGRDQIFVQPIDPGEDGDWFGFALATGRFAGHSGSDLAIGAPFAQVGAFAATGIVSVLASQALFLDGLESGDTGAWSAAAP